MSQPAHRVAPRKKRRIRILPILGYVIAALGLAWFFEARLPTTIVIVRHADTDGTMQNDDDPSLNAAGRVRAEELADFLADVDVVASVNAIYASDKRRTQQTAEPLARRLGLEIKVEDMLDYERLVRHIERDHGGDIVLVVTHSNAIAPLIDELHGKKGLPAIAPDEYDNVYIITSPRFGAVKTLRLHYGARVPATTLSGGGETSTVTAPR
jgi:broad specificity phosphatase PhoE